MSATPVVTAVAFDADGRRIQSRDGSDAAASTTFDGLGRATGSSDGLGLTAGQVVYDDAGRVVAEADALGNVTRTPTTPWAGWWRRPTPWAA